MISKKNRQLLAVVVVVLAIISSFIYNVYSNVMATYADVQLVTEQEHKKRALLSTMYSAARERSLILLKMYTEDDPFELDDFNQDMSEQARIFIKARSELLEQQLNAEESALLTAQNKLTSVNAPLQNQTAQFLFDGDRDAAHEILFKQAIPGQNMVLEHIDQVISIYERNSNAFIASTKSNMEDSSKSLLLLGAALLFIGLFVIFIIATRMSRQEEQELESRNLELEQKTEELEAFSYSLSHDLRAPLKTIQGFSKRLEKKLLEEDNTELQIYSAQITKNALRLDGLIEDTLAITQAENLMENNCELDLEEILHEIQDQLSEINRENLIQFRFQLNHKESLTSQQTRIRLILANLISNSIKYSNKDGGQQFVEVVTSNKEDNVFEIRVIDNGIGIPVDQQDKVYSMFFRAHTSIAFGSGLGLHLVRKNVKKLGGSINFNSSNDGTEFVIRLPQAA